MVSRPYSIKFTLIENDLPGSVAISRQSLKNAVVFYVLPLIVFAIIVETHFLDALFNKDGSGLSVVIFRTIYGSGLVGCVLIFVLLPIFLTLLNLYQHRRLQKYFPLDVTVTVTDTQLLYDSAQAKLCREWTSFTRRVETETSFLLSHSDKRGTDVVWVIPKRAFTNGELLADFLSLLDKWMPAKAR